MKTRRGYVEDEKERGNIIWVAKDTLKSHMIKCTAFRAGAFALLPSDVPYLEEIGILARQFSVIPRRQLPRCSSVGPVLPTIPIIATADDLKREGQQSSPPPSHRSPTMVSTATLTWALTDLVPLFWKQTRTLWVITLGMRDYHDSLADLQKTIRYFRERGAHFTTMTQAASEHFAHNVALAGV